MTETVHDLGALRALREVGRHGSIAAAASVLGVSQQALSARMRTLERAMGVTLLARTPSGSHLTEQGRLVVGWAEDVLDAADRLEAGLRSIRSGVSHRLAIAASQTIAEHLVPHWLVELRSVEQASGAHGDVARGNAASDAAEQAAGYPPTVVELTVANSTGVLELVRDGKAGLGFIETPHLPSDLVTEHVRDDELLVVTAPGHPWAGRRRPLELAEIAATPLVMREAGQRYQGHADRSSRRPGPAAAADDRDGARDQRRRQVGDRGRGRPRACSAGSPSGTTWCSAASWPSRSPAPTDQAAHRRLETRRSAPARGTAAARRRHGRPVASRREPGGAAARPGGLAPASSGRTSRTRCGRRGG